MVHEHIVISDYCLVTTFGLNPSQRIRLRRCVLLYPEERVIKVYILLYYRVASV